MFIHKLVELINHKLADELISQARLLDYMDAVIDDINVQLNSCFPTFSEFIEQNGSGNDPDYNVFPDKYQRSVVVVGAALKFYEVDEEGNATAETFVQDYKQQLFYMLRDYSFAIPEQYRSEHVGAVALNNEKLNAPGLQIASNDPFDTGDLR